MSSHPDADAFMRTYLRTPTDVTTRLVFADWLEETGTPSNVAWATYIRLKAEAAHHPPWRHEWDEWERAAAEYAPHVRARLTIPAGLFVGFPKSLLELLPSPNLTVRLDAFTPPPWVLGEIPEGAARNTPLLPLDRQDRVLLLASADPQNPDLVGKLEFVLNRVVILVRAECDGIRDAVARLYWPAGATPGDFNTRGTTR